MDTETIGRGTGVTKMDLGAYAQIENLGAVASQNGISVPRLRGYRLLKDEKPMDYLEAMGDGYEAQIVMDLIHAMPFWTYDSSWSAYGGEEYDWAENHYLSKDRNAVRWENIHGWKRRVLKLAIHTERKKYKKQYEVWNRYTGRDDILYAHARIGGKNWAYYKDYMIGDLIERVDDAWDCTYCDLYFRIKPVTERKE